MAITLGVSPSPHEDGTPFKNMAVRAGKGRVHTIYDPALQWTEYTNSAADCTLPLSVLSAILCKPHALLEFKNNIRKCIHMEELE